MYEKLNLTNARRKLNQMGIDNNYTNFRYHDKNNPQAIILHKRPTDKISTYLKPRKDGLAVKKNENGVWKYKRLYSLDDLEIYFKN